MNKVFKDLATYVRLHDGYNKPKINFQEMYKLFPKFDFMPTPDFGKYFGFGEAFGHKDLSMTVRYENYSCLIIYKEYDDVDENAAYVC